MITKELARELFHDLGYEVNGSVQYFQKVFTIDESQIPADGYVYAGYFNVINPQTVASDSGIVVEGKIKNNLVLYLQSLSGTVSVGQNGFSTLSVASVFGIIDQIQITGETGVLNFCGYRMKI